MPKYYSTDTMHSYQPIDDTMDMRLRVAGLVVKFFIVDRTTYALLTKTCASEDNISCLEMPN